jgi:ATP-dependent helicase/nuclease subunit B
MRVKWVEYGRPAAAALLELLRSAKQRDPLAPVTVVVPSNHVGVAARRLLASGELGAVAGRGTGVAGVYFLTVYRLAELMGSATLAGHGRRPVSTPVIAAALRNAVRSDPGVFSPVAENAATEVALVGAYRELRDLSEAALERLASQSRRASDVVRLCRGARSLLAPRWYDEEDLMAAASNEVRREGAPQLGPVVVYLPQSLSRHAASLLISVAGRVEVTVLAGATGDGRADDEVVKTVSRLSGAREVAQPSPRIDPMREVRAEDTLIVTASDADEEVRSAVRCVLDAVRDGTNLDRIAVLLGSPRPYARLVHEQLESAGIAHNGTSVALVAARVAGRTMLGLLALRQRQYRREEVFAWLSGALIRHGSKRAPVAAWERLSREAGVVKGRVDWDRRLLEHASFCEERAEKADEDPDSPGWRPDHLRDEARRTRELREFVLGIIGDLEGIAAQPRRWSELAAWAGRRLVELLGDEGSRGDWPRAETEAARRVQRSIERLATLDEIEGPVGLDLFLRTLELELESDLGRVGRIGEGTLVGPLGAGIGLDLDLVVVLGLAEGLLPAQVHEDALLPDRERQAALGELALRAGSVERQHRELLASLACSARHVLGVPRGDLRKSAVRIPSRWAVQAASAMAGESFSTETLLTSEHGWLRHVPSQEAGLRRVSFPTNEQEYRLRALMAAGPSPGRSPGGVLVDALLEAATEVATARKGARFTRFDGHLAGVRVPSPTGLPVSATRLETWARCPFAYFMGSLLGVEEPEKPEERLEISPLDRGSLVHEVLERFVSEILSRPPEEQPSPHEAWSQSDRRRLRQIAEECCDSYERRGLTGRPIFWKQERKRLLSDFDQFLDCDGKHRADRGTRPVAVELSFGGDGAQLVAEPLELPDGRSVTFRGRIDRVDVADDGSVEVIDYKTGSSNGYRGLSEANPDAGGTMLQLPVYALAARAYMQPVGARVHAGYWFVSTKGGFERRGFDVTDDVLSRVGRTVGLVVGGIESGVFPSRPPDSAAPGFGDCPYCNPDGIGSGDLARRVERKKGDSAVWPYLDLLGGPGA